MKLVNFHKDTSEFVNIVTNFTIQFTEDYARMVASTHKIKNMHIVYRELKEHKIIYPHEKLQEVWIFDLRNLAFYFTRERWN